MFFRSKLCSFIIYREIVCECDVLKHTVYWKQEPPTSSKQMEDERSKE